MSIRRLKLCPIAAAAEAVLDDCCGPGPLLGFGNDMIDQFRFLSPGQTVLTLPRQELGIRRNSQADMVGHGGEFRAVLVYSL